MSSARTDLCGGRSAMVVPTATGEIYYQAGGLPRYSGRYAHGSEWADS